MIGTSSLASEANPKSPSNGSEGGICRTFVEVSRRLRKSPFRIVESRF